MVDKEQVVEALREVYDPDIAITFPPGARGSFLYAYLTNKIDTPEFEFKIKIPMEYKHVINPVAISKFKYRIFVKVDLEMLSIWLYLYWQKNLVVMFPDYDDLLTANTFDKLYVSARYFYDYTNESDLSCFNYIVPFSKIFDWEYLRNLYFMIHGVYPNNKKIIVQTNTLNEKTKPPFQIIQEIIRLENKLQLKDHIFIEDMHEVYLKCIQHKDVSILEKFIVPSNYSKNEFIL